MSASTSTRIVPGDVGSSAHGSRIGAFVEIFGGAGAAGILGAAGALGIAVTAGGPDGGGGADALAAGRGGAGGAAGAGGAGRAETGVGASPAGRDEGPGGLEVVVVAGCFELEGA